ncbi:MAG: aminodeoxychorismate synthase component I, partial [Paraperlucidibaca sp.]
MHLASLPWQDTPLPYANALITSRWPLLLDSQNAGRWQIIVAEPRATAVLNLDGWLFEGWPGAEGDSFAVMAALQAWGKALCAPEATDLPFVSGVMGYVGYAAPSEHGLPDRHCDDWPLATLAYYDQGIALDSEKHEAWVWASAAMSSADWQDWQQRCQSTHTPTLDPFKLNAAFHPCTTQARYAEDIARIHELIRAGDCYQVNYTQAYEAKHTGRLWTRYEQLRRLARAPYGAYWALPWGELLSLSPEQFIGIDGRTLTTRPIKGTRARNNDSEQDFAEACALAASAKDMAENIMITDLLRNDLSKHARIGSVSVPELCAVKSFGQVHHLVTTITATLNNDAVIADVLRDAFPGGSITGAPKKRVMEIIEAIEPTARGVYCGMLFYWDTRGRVDSSITIRTLVSRQGLVRTWAGGGITLDSTWQAEYDECRSKMG